MARTLAHSIVTATGATPDKAVLFLHGIFGSGANWRSFARRYVEAKPEWCAVLVDLRMHGESQGFDPPHDLPHAAADVEGLARSFEPSLPVRALVGHSFGGKVVMQTLRAADEEGTSSALHGVETAFIIDSTPSMRKDARGSESTLAILAHLESLPRDFDSRDSFTQALGAFDVAPSIVQWLAMNVRRDGDRFRFRVDLDAVRSLLDDYFARDYWDLFEGLEMRAERPVRRLDLIVGGDSNVFDEDDRKRAAAAATKAPERVHLAVIPKAGHWVHVDAPDALFEEICR